MAVRRQMEMLEQKLMRDFKSSQLMETRLREEEMKRYSQKLMTVEKAQRDLSGASARHEGMWKAMSDELHSQSGRITSEEARTAQLWDELSKELRTKTSSTTRNYDELKSEVRVMKAAAHDRLTEYTKKLERLSSLVEERDFGQLAHNVEQLHSRLKQVEDLGLEYHRHLSLTGQLNSASNTLDLWDPQEKVDLAGLESRVQDVLVGVEQLQLDHRELIMKVQMHEERYKGLRSELDAKVGQIRSNQLERETWESRFAELEVHCKELESRRLSQTGLLEQLCHDVGNRKAAQEELSQSLLRLRDRTVETSLALLQSAEFDMQHTVCATGVASDVEEIVLKMSDLPAEMDETKKKLEILQSDHEVIANVGAFMTSLQDVTPKVIDQEARLRGLADEANDLLVHMSNLQREVALKLTEHSRQIQELGGALSRLEGEVKRS